MGFCAGKLVHLGVVAGPKLVIYGGPILFSLRNIGCRFPNLRFRPVVGPQILAI